MKAKKQNRIAVFSSGFGSNLEALLTAEKKGRLGGYVALVVCDSPEAYTIRRAKRHKRPVFLIQPKHYDSREAFEAAIIEVLHEQKINLICLAGFMRILTRYFFTGFKGKILNVHPSLLPAFKGAHAIKDAYTHGVKVTGVTVHVVTRDLDNGPIIMQKALSLKERETLIQLEKRIHRIEHEIYPEAVRLVIQNKVRLKGRKVLIKRSS